MNRRRRLVLILTIELLAAGAARWPLTTSDIRTQFEYQLAQVVITSENWHREGALARHLIPTRSTDHRLSEWPYYDQDYITVPPLSFAAHYAAVKLFPHTDPTVVARLVAQMQIAAGVLVGAMLFERTIGLWPTLAGFSFLIWTLPFLVWYVNGYFPTTTALVVQLAATGWVLVEVKRWAAGRGAASSPARRRTPIVAAAVFATLGVCSEAIGLAVNAAIAAVFAVLALASYRAKRRDALEWLSLALTTAVATIVTLTAIVVLYATRTEFAATFVDRFRDRAGLKTGRAPIVEHAHTIFMQMRTAWPKALVLVFACTAIALAIWYVVQWWRGTASGRRDAAVGLAALWLTVVPSTIYHYMLAAHVTIHWWFAGTWTIAWVAVIALAAHASRRAIEPVVSRAAVRGFTLVTASTLAIATIAASWPHTNLAEWERGLAAKTFPISMYHALGDRLPRDDIYPIVPVELGDLFRDYPFATAYLRRSVVLVTYDELALPWEDEPADLARLAELGQAYVVYDPAQRACGGTPVPLASWQYHRIAVCRVAARDLLDQRSAVVPLLGVQSSER